MSTKKTSADSDLFWEGKPKPISPDSWFKKLVSKTENLNSRHSRVQQRPVWGAKSAGNYVPSKWVTSLSWVVWLEKIRDKINVNAMVIFQIFFGSTWDVNWRFSWHIWNFEVPQPWKQTKGNENGQHGQTIARHQHDSTGQQPCLALEVKTARSSCCV